MAAKILKRVGSASKLGITANSCIHCEG